MKLHELVNVDIPCGKSTRRVISGGVVVAVTSRGARVWDWRNKESGGSPEMARNNPNAIEWFSDKFITSTGKVASGIWE